MKIKLIHWDINVCAVKAQHLKSLGHAVDSESERNTETFKRIKKQIPDVYIIDLSRLPSYGKEIAVGLRQIKRTKNIPIIFVDGETAKAEKIKSVMPDAIYTPWQKISNAITKAMKQKETEKIVPTALMDRYWNTPLVKKLGIKENLKVAFINTPKNFIELLGELPSNIKFSKTLKKDCDLIVWFVFSRERFDLGFFDILENLKSNKLWVCTPKKSSGIDTDINQNVVRQIGLSEGLVDFKVCSIDDVWTGLLFTRRK